MAPGPLAQVLRQLPSFDDPNFLTAAIPFADAGVYRISPGCALVQSVDFFTPIVDDPATFGRIAAANALSDVYAMGGVPMMALNLLGYPPAGVPNEVLGEILAGAGETCAGDCVTGCAARPADPGRDLARLALLALLGLGVLTLRRFGRRRPGHFETNQNGTI